MAPALKILHVTLSFHDGGRREAILSLVRGLSTLGVENHLCCIDELGPERDFEGGPFRGLLDLQRHGLFDAAALRRLRRYCLEHDITVLHSHDAASEGMCALALPFTHIPLLMSFHRSRNFESARMRDRVRNAIVGLRVSAIVTASEARREHYRKRNFLPAKKVLRIPLGIDTDRFMPDEDRRRKVRRTLQLDEDHKLVGVVGHFGPDKGVDIAIDAFQRMCHQFPHMNASLLILGTGSNEQQAFVANCIGRGSDKRIHFAGFQRHTEHWFPGFDLLLHGARREAFGLVLIEAMACGVPVVAPAIGGMRDIIVDGVSGRLAPVGDIDALADMCGQLLSNPSRLAQMSYAARQRILKEYTTQLYAQRFLDLYKSLTGRAEDP